MVGDSDGSFSPPEGPPGTGEAPDVELGKQKLRKDQRLPSLKPRPWSLLYGILLGLLFVIGDARLYPGEQGLTAGHKIVLLIAVCIAIAAFIMAWTKLRPAWMLLLGAVVVGSIAAAASGDWFGGATEAPEWRNAIVPAIDVAFLIAAALTWYLGRREPAQMLLVMSLVATGLVYYGQQNAPLWAVLVAAAASLLFLVPRVDPPARFIGLGVHGLALLGLVVAQPTWFTWTPFPFLSLIPAYLILMYFRATGSPRRGAWWTAVASGGLLLLLGTSTLIGRLREGFPIGESLLMQGMGVAMLGAFLALHFFRPRPAAEPAAADA